MSVQKYLQMREKWLKCFVKFLNPDAVSGSKNFTKSRDEKVDA